MLEVKVYDIAGKEVKKVALNPAIFGLDVQEQLIHLGLLRQLGNARLGIAKVKDRGERRGGGKKPWKQKHTGRARTGSIRAAQWKKGGRIFGPTGLENYSKTLPRKQRIKALCGLLSLKAADQQIVCLNKYNVKEAKTKTLTGILGKLPLGRSTLIIVPNKNATLSLSARNLPYIKVLLYGYVNIADLMKYDSLLVFPETLEKFNKLWGSLFNPDKKPFVQPESKKAVKATPKKKVAAKPVKEEKKVEAPKVEAVVAEKPKAAVPKAPVKKVAAKPVKKIVAKKAVAKPKAAPKAKAKAAPKKAPKKTTKKSS